MIEEMSQRPEHGPLLSLGMTSFGVLLGATGVASIAQLVVGSSAVSSLSSIPCAVSILTSPFLPISCVLISGLFLRTVAAGCFLTQRTSVDTLRDFLSDAEREEQKARDFRKEHGDEWTARVRFLAWARGVVPVFQAEQNIEEIRRALSECEQLCEAENDDD